MDFKEWFNQIPRITKIYMCTIFGVTVLATYGILSPFYIFIEYEMAVKKLQIWRFITCFCFIGKFSFNFLMYMMMIHNKFTKLEKEAEENRRYAEFVYMLIVLMVFILLVTFFLDQAVFLCMELIFAVIYIDCKRNPDIEVQLYMWKLKNQYLPWAMLFLSFLIGGNVMSDLVGIAVGHLYYYLKDIVPQLYRYDLLATPGFLINQIDRRLYGNPTRANFGTINSTGGAASFRPGFNNGNTGTGGNNNTNTGGFTAFQGRGASWGS